jgi:hypothetical protein
MAGELSKIGEYAVACWAGRDRAVEHRLDEAAYLMSRAMAAVDGSGQFPRLADALDEAVRQFEHGSIALLMNLTPAAADAARRILEVIFFTAFMRWDPARLSAWHAGAEEFRFTGPLKQYFRAAGTAVAHGPYGEAPTLNLYKRASASVHANPRIWSESRDGLKVEAQSFTFAAREEMLQDAARTVVYVTLHELRDLDIDGIEDFFGPAWAAVRGALGI